jgi:hypothetical protein
MEYSIIGGEKWGFSPVSVASASALDLDHVGHWNSRRPARPPGCSWGWKSGIGPIIVPLMRRFNLFICSPFEVCR